MCLFKDAVVSLNGATIIIIFASKNIFPVVGEVDVLSNHLINYASVIFQRPVQGKLIVLSCNKILELAV